MTIVGRDKFNICVHWFSCTQNGFVRTFVHAKLHVHKTVIVGTSLHRLIYDVLTEIVLPIFCYHLNLKNISQAYAQHKGFNCMFLSCHVCVSE